MPAIAWFGLWGLLWPIVEAAVETYDPWVLGVMYVKTVVVAGALELSA